MSKSVSMILTFAFMLSFLSVAHAQMPGKTLERTVTLPNGGVIMDMSGEWDIFVEYYGAFYWLESIKTVTKITQNGTAFTGIRVRNLTAAACEAPAMTPHPAPRCKREREGL